MKMLGMCTALAARIQKKVISQILLDAAFVNFFKS